MVYPGVYDYLVVHFLKKTNATEDETHSNSSPLLISRILVLGFLKIYILGKILNALPQKK